MLHNHGAGEFTGIRRPDNTVKLSFISNDQDKGCGFDKGWRFLIDTQLSNNGTALTGNYKVNNNTHVRPMAFLCGLF